MLKFLPLTALALGLSSGVALADHHREYSRGATYEHRAPVVVRDHRGYDNRGWERRGYDNRGWDRRGGYENRVVVRDRGWYGGGGAYVHDGASYRHFVRRPIYVSRPVIRERYYNYYRRPALVVESYGPRDGYYWVAGAWSWNGFEWIWQPGHYEPDPNYVEPYYDSY